MSTKLISSKINKNYKYSIFINKSFKEIRFDYNFDSIRDTFAFYIEAIRSLSDYKTNDKFNDEDTNFNTNLFIKENNEGKVPIFGLYNNGHFISDATISILKSLKKIYCNDKDVKRVDFIVIINEKIKVDRITKTFSLLKTSKAYFLRPEGFKGIYKKEYISTLIIKNNIPLLTPRKNIVYEESVILFDIPIKI